MTDRFSPAAMLDAYRGNASDYMREQVAAFRTLNPGDQREFLFFMIANMAIAQSAIVDLMPSAEATE